MSETRDRLRLRGACALLAAGFFAASAGAALAQETRTEEITKKQEEKAKAAAPYKPTAYERILNQLEANYVSPPSGVFPYFGSVYPGGGFTLGAGYRQFFAKESVWQIAGLYSIKNYKAIEFAARTPWNNSGRWNLGFRAGWKDAPQVGYYGIGNDTLSDDRANFRVKQTYGGVNLLLKPAWWTRLGAEVLYDKFEDEAGRGAAPSIETRFNAATAPGLFAQPKYIHTEGIAAIDWRPAADYARKGGFYGVKVVDYADLDDTFSFRRVDGEIIQHLPILRENWVLSFRGRVQSVLDDDDSVPYYLLPYLGSGSTLRGYGTARFRDRHALLTTAEFRWIPSRLALDVALFYDAGKVTAKRSDLDFNGLTTDWGIGVRFHSPVSTPLRIEMARGKEGWHLVFSSGAAF
jgi:outer membrane protein assembly factor BamA